MTLVATIRSHMIEELQLEAGKRLINAGFDAFKCSRIEHGVRVELEPEHFRILPGLLRPVKFEPEAHAPTPDHIRWAQPPRVDFFADATAPITHMQTYVLELKQFGMQVEVDVTEPVPRRHDYSMRWKAHPPSKRRHMKSWRYAPDAEKRRYAPCKGMRWLPYWAHHPDANRRTRLGLVIVTQRLFVYAQQSVDVEAQMREHADEWLRKISDAFRLT